MNIWPGKAYPLGATYDGAGTNFSIFSSLAHKVELCLFDDKGKETRYELPEVTAYCWHGYLSGIGPGQLYGYRIHGPGESEKGFRCNPNKLLLDPYAKAIDEQVKWNEAVFSYFFNHPEEGVNDLDSAPYVPKGVVINPYFDWGYDRPPLRPLNETIIYEVHVKGFTFQHPDIPPSIRGTYLGLVHPVSLEYFKKLGITSIELLPIHQFINDSHLEQKGLSNYWGYNTIGYFAPHNAYSSAGGLGQQVQEFKQMVKILHQEGIEVILDVVYNHTAEGNHLGPTLSFRGIDNPTYYRLMADTPSYYTDYTGTGNSLNMRHPHVLQLVMDSLRYWILEMHVDGFRFDLAATLARELHDVDKLSAFFDIIQQDPVISQVKLIAEPWDVGEGGYQVGNFPPLWSEWNGKYRDCVRDFWKGTDRKLSEFAYRFTGSSDLYENTGRRPFASINFVTGHDGFTLHDLVSYNEKHNQDNGENNMDGSNDNLSWNCGHEGDIDQPDILALRQKQKRNFLVTLFLSQGVPMLLAGDEFGRTQKGNNNAYCQDNEISWLDWKKIDHHLLGFCQKLISFYKGHPIFRRRRWFQGYAIHGQRQRDIMWFTPDGNEMHEDNWNDGPSKSMAIYLNGQAIPSRDSRGGRIVDDSFLILINAHYDSLDFILSKDLKGRWVKVIDTAAALIDDITPDHIDHIDLKEKSTRQLLRSHSKLTVPDRSLLLLKNISKEK
ncbi:MAG: glycogen debranching protein GlgX [Oligoflexia bacterium]|nr:glycogen debranching protein GlgX [Oligoflexia bacterium]